MRPTSTNDTEDLVEAALIMLARVEGTSPASRDAQLSEWRSKSPAHADALNKAIAEWNLFGQLTPRPLSKLERMQLAGQTAWASAIDHPAQAGIAICALLVLALVPLFLTDPLSQPDHTSELVLSPGPHQHTALHYREAVRHTTKRGEQKFVSLPDGSSLWLNWNSEVLVAVLEDEVHVDILRGDALFSVSESKRRPLVVHAGDTFVSAPQTEFAIHSHSPHDAFFQVKEGIVNIMSTGSTVPVQLSAAEQAYFENGKGTAPRSASLSSIAAWRQGKLIFDEQPLIEVLYELSHYTEHPLQVGHVIETGDRVSATFDLADADHALLQLADQYRLEVLHPASENAIVRSIDNRRL